MSGTLTNNVDPNAGAPESDQITRLTAGVTWRARTGFLRGSVDYALTGVAYARHSRQNAVQNALNAALLADMVPDRLQVTMDAAVGRGAISAFGAQPVGGSDRNGNTTETRSLRVSPTLRGFLTPAVRYDAAINYSQTDSGVTRLGQSSSSGATLRVQPVQRARLGWTLDASILRSDIQSGRASSTERLNGGLQWDLGDHDLQLGATVGSERSDVLTLDPQRSTTWGVSGVWAPSALTRLSASWERRFFGHSHAIDFEQRTARTVLRLRSARSLSTSGTSVSGQTGVAFDLFFDSPALKAQVPDAQARADFVNALLRDRGIDPARIIDTGFLTAAATVQDSLILSAGWNSARQAVLLSLGRTRTSRADTLSTAIDDLSQYGTVRTFTLALDLSHRLTPDSALGLLLSLQRADGSQSGTSTVSSRQSSVDLNYNLRLTPRSTLTAALRHVQHNTTDRDTSETALTASYGVRF